MISEGWSHGGGDRGLHLWFGPDWLHMWRSLAVCVYHWNNKLDSRVNFEPKSLDSICFILWLTWTIILWQFGIYIKHLLIAMCDAICFGVLSLGPAVDLDLQQWWLSGAVCKHLSGISSPSLRSCRQNVLQECSHFTPNCTLLFPFSSWWELRPPSVHCSDGFLVQASFHSKILLPFVFSNFPFLGLDKECSHFTLSNCTVSI